MMRIDLAFKITNFIFDAIRYLLIGIATFAVAIGVTYVFVTLFSYVFMGTALIAAGWIVEQCYKEFVK